MIMYKTFKKYCSSIAVKAAVVALVNVMPGVSEACGPEPYIGSVCFTAASYCPEGYLPADGRMLNISQYQALFAVIGNVYGGDGRTTFALPDLRGRVPVGTGMGAGLTQNITIGQKRGTEAVVLTPSQTPQASHTHLATFSKMGEGADSLVAKGRVTLPLSGSVSNVPVSGSVAVNALTTQTGNGSNMPSSIKNTAGKNGIFSKFYPYNSTAAVASPVTVNLKATGGALTGAATGDVSLPVSGNSVISGGTVAVAPNVPVQATQPVSLLNPELGLTACIAVQGIFPSRP
jgi:microcystin-dependent protein